jgi:hypothetical protein
VGYLYRRQKTIFEGALDTLNPYASLILMLFVVIGPFMGVVLWMRNNKKVPVTGIDTSAGRKSTRRLLPVNGAVVWAEKGASKIMVPLDAGFAYRGPRGPEYIIDITPGQGVPLTLTDGSQATEVSGLEVRSARTALRLDGSRMYQMVIGHGLQDVSASGRTNLERLLTIAVIGGGIGLVTILGAIVYLVNMFQKANQATGGAAGDVAGQVTGVS